MRPPAGLVVATSLLLCSTADAREALHFPGPYSPVTIDCVETATTVWGHRPDDLWLLLSVERGTVGTCLSNENGSRDCGPWQINTSAVPELADLLSLSEGETERLIAIDGCLNAHAAAYILWRKSQSTADKDTALVRYHSATPKHAARYSKLLEAARRKLRP